MYSNKIAQLILAVPFVAEFVAEMTTAAAATGEAAGLSAATARALAGVGTAVATGYATSSANEFITETIGKDKVSSARNTFDDILAQATGAMNQDASAFINTTRAHNATSTTGTKKHIDFNNEAVPTDMHHLDISKTMEGSTGTGTEEPLKTDPIRPSYTPRDVAGYVTKLATNAAAQAISDGPIDLSRAISDTIKSSPSVYSGLAPMIAKIVDNNLGSSEQYNAIASIYNGLDMEVYKNMKMFYDNTRRLVYFELVDELGSVSTIYQTEGLVLPSIDVFAGPKSSNDRMPSSIYGLFCAFHDSDYNKGGYFNRTGDYKLVSRLSQNFSRIPPEFQSYAKATIVYFSTLGHIVSNLSGNSDVSVPVQNSDKLTLSSDIHSIIGQGQEKSKFYNELGLELEEMNLTNSMFSQGTVFERKMLEKDFESIMVEML